MTDDNPRRALILKVATELFTHYGPRKTTVSDIAERASLGVGTIYLEFPSKDAILETLAAERHRALLADLRAALAGRGAPETRLRRALDARARAFAALARAPGHEGEVLHGACPRVEAAFERYCAHERALFAEFLAEASREGVLACARPETTAEALLSAYSRFAPPLVFLRLDEAWERELSALHALVLHGLLPRNR